MGAVGITDHGNMHGAYEMYTEAVKQDVKPIIGIEAYVRRRRRGKTNRACIGHGGATA